MIVPIAILVFGLLCIVIGFAEIASGGANWGFSIGLGIALTIVGANAIRWDMQPDGLPCMACGEHAPSMDAIIYDPDPDVGSYIAVFPVCASCYEELSADEVTECFKKLCREHWSIPVGRGAWETFRENAKQDKEGL